MAIITERDLVDSLADALQFISYYHPPDFIAAMADAFEREENPNAKQAIGQILANSRMAAIGHRPVCQDTGTANVFFQVGVQAKTDWTRPLQEMVNEAVARAYTSDTNPLRASMVTNPYGARKNSGDNTPAMVHVELVAGDEVHVQVSAKGAGSENKSRFAVLNPSDSVADWVIEQVKAMGAGWCPPGILGIGIGGSADKAMAMAKDAQNDPIDIFELKARGPANKLEELRLEILERVNDLGIGAQGLGGVTTALDVKIKTMATHAASLPVALIPNCAATRHVDFTLDGSGRTAFTPPDLSLWPQDVLEQAGMAARKVDLDALDRDLLDSLVPGETLLLSGTLFTGRDAAHKRMVDTLESGGELPVDLKGRAIYYVGPVDPVGDEVVGPAGPTTANRMDKFTDRVLSGTGLSVMIGKAERGPTAIEAIRKHGAVYLIAVGGAAYLVSKAIKASEPVAYEDLGMEAIYRMSVEEMPVMVAVDTKGNSIHQMGPARWSKEGRAAA